MWAKWVRRMASLNRRAVARRMFAAPLWFGVAGGLLASMLTLFLPPAVRQVLTGVEANAADLPVLRAALTAPIGTLNPFLATSDAELSVLRHQYEALVCITPEGHTTGCLAQSYSSEDGLTWTYHLPEGRVWSDGKPITAADVVFTLRTLMEAQGAQDTEDTEAGTGVLVGERYAQVAQFAELSTSDSHTVTLTLREPSPVPPGSDIFIVPRHIWVDYPDALTNPTLPLIDWATVASGPFLTTTFSADRVALRTNPLYWQGPAAIAGIDWLTYPDLAAAIAALQADAVDVVTDLGVAAYQALQADTAAADHIATVSGAGERALTLHFNLIRATGTDTTPTQRATVFADPAVRAAITRSFDVKELVNTVFAGLAQPGITPAVPAWPAYFNELPDDIKRVYDPVAAAESLTLAGYRLGSTGERLGRDGLPITLHLGYDPADELQLLAVPEVVRVLAELNIAVVPTPVSAAELAASTAPDAVSSFDFYLQTHRESADPGATVLSGSCALTTGWCDTAYDELAAAQAKEMGPDRRAAFVREAYQLSYQADALLVLGYPDSLAAYRTDRFESFGLSEGALSLRSGSWAYYQAKPVLRHDAPWPAVSVRSNRWGWYSGVAIVALGIVGYAVVRFRDWRKRRADGA